VPQAGFLYVFGDRTLARRQPSLVEDADVVVMEAAGLQRFDRGLCVLCYIEHRNQSFVSHYRCLYFDETLASAFGLALSSGAFGVRVTTAS
jgi:hypothetical protein